MEIDLTLRDPEGIVREITTFLRTQMERAELKKGVIALSGGIDSAVVATLAVRALGSERVVSHVLPDGEVTPKEDIEDAEGLAESLGILCRRISIHGPLEAFEQTLKEAGLLGDHVAWGNVKPRLRMIASYFVANFEQGLVLGTGNKSELLIGYYTKYGDGGVDVLPLGHLYKTQVRQLARHLGLPDRIIQKAPSATLWEGQTDEEEIGLSYPELDRVLHCLHDREISVSETAAALRMDRVRVRRIADMMEKNAHKLMPPPMPG